MKSRVAVSRRAIRSAATSRVRNSVSARLRSSRVRSCSRKIRSRSVCRFCASRISGAAYEACKERIKVSRV